MIGISGFLEKFLKFEKDNNTKLLLITEAIKKVTGIELEKSNLEIIGDQVRLNCSPVFRNEIFMNKEEIENNLKTQKVFLKII